MFGNCTTLAENFNGNLLRDSIWVSVGPKKRVYLGPDTAFCDSFSYLLKAGNRFQNFLWSTSDTLSSITIDKAGNYWVEVTDSNSCDDADTINIDAIKKPLFILTLDSVDCKYVTINLNQSGNNKTFWSTGSSDTFIKVDEKGRYYLTTSNQFCSRTDSIDVNKLPKPEVNLMHDIRLCDDHLELRSSESGNHVWSDGTKETSIKYINQFLTISDTLWLKVYRNGCVDTDTVLILPCIESKFFIPNAFTPNKNYLNEKFGVVGLIEPKEFSMKIYNRWGELIFVSSNVNASWNGIYQDTPVPFGTYFYTVDVLSSSSERIRKNGTIMLLR